MQKRKVDVVVIGGGTAGLVARRTAEKEGASTLLIGSEPFGTTCARVGCMPSKLLIAAAESAHAVRKAGVFGLQSTLKVDGRRVMERVKNERDYFVSFVLESMDELEKTGKLLRGKARFLDAHQIQVDEEVVEAKTTVVATGSKPVIPPPYRQLGDCLLTHEEVFKLRDLPKSLLVVGTGIIGLELGQAFHRLGTKVTFLGLDHFIGPLSDPEVKTTAENIFASEMDLHSHHRLVEVRKINEGVEVQFEGADGKLIKDVYEYVLAAAGTKPQFDGLDLEKAGIALDDAGGVTVNPSTLRVGDSNIFLAGDASRFRPVLHEASHGGRIAGRNAAHFPNVQEYERKVRLNIVFTDPQMAMVGSSWKELEGEEFSVGEIDYARQGRSRVMAVNQGKVRIYGKPGSCEILGAEMFGPAVEHTAHLMAWAIQNGFKVDKLLELPVYHPVFEEGIETAIENLRAALEGAEPCGCRCDEYGPGV